MRVLIGLVSYWVSYVFCFCVARFARLRSDVLVKLELLDQKHVQDIVFQLQVSGV